MYRNYVFTLLKEYADILISFNFLDFRIQAYLRRFLLKYKWP